MGRAADHSQSPSDDSRSRAIEEHLPLVSSLARRHARKGEPFEDLPARNGGPVPDFDPTPWVEKRVARRMGRFSQLALVASLLALGAIFCALGLAWLVLYATLVGRGAMVLRRPAVRRTLDRATGVVLVALGIRLAFEQR